MDNNIIFETWGADAPFKAVNVAYYNGTTAKVEIPADAKHPETYGKNELAAVVKEAYNAGIDEITIKLFFRVEIVRFEYNTVIDNIPYAEDYTADDYINDCDSNGVDYKNIDGHIELKKYAVDDIGNIYYL